jgi:hypothetical protein
MMRLCERHQDDQDEKPVAKATLPIVELYSGA